MLSRRTGAISFRAQRQMKLVHESSANHSCWMSICRPARISSSWRSWAFHRLPYVLVFTAIIGAVLFAQGFLQVRRLIETKSRCEEPPVAPIFFPKAPLQESCWLPATRRKFIILVIDALRIDFVLPSRTGSPAESAWYDRLSVLDDLARSDPSHAKMLHFVADPPTATTQRLSGIAAGTLPAFVEVASSFAETSLSSDNFVHQLLSHPTRYLNFDFYGDDTWLHLFPIIESQSKGTISGFHSFHLFDLHSVDDGIKEKLYPALESAKFDVIVAHFLGVDHCGHKYGPMHQLCGKKLAEMDSILREVIRRMDSNTTLFVFGDHGMTDNGDHGGISEKEVSSVLFSYQKNPSNKSDPSQEYLDFWNSFFARVEAARVKSLELPETPFYKTTNDFESITGSVTQIDFTPTISLLAGVPIPFGNVGIVIPELLLDQSLPEHYSNMICGQVTCNSQDKTKALLLARVHNMKILVESIRMNAHQVLSFISANGQLKEPGFDPLIIEGLSNNMEIANTSLSALLLKFPSLVSTSVDADDAVLIQISLGLEKVFFQYQDYLVGTLKHCRRIWADFNVSLIASGLALGVSSVLLLFLFIFQRGINYSEAGSLLLSIFHTVSLGSTSFVAFENGQVGFLLSSLVGWRIFQLLCNRSIDKSNLLQGLALLLLTRLMSYTGACREEQYPYCQVVTHKSLVFGPSVSVFATLAVGAIGLLCVLKFCQSSLTRVKSKGLSALGKSLYLVMILILGAHWIWIWLSESGGEEAHRAAGSATDQLQLVMSIALPRTLFISSALSAVLFRKSGALLLVSLAVFIATAQRPFGGWALLVPGTALLQMGSSFFASSTDQVSPAVFFYLAGMHLFFVTGHQATLTSIQWEAAFVGLQSTIQWIAGPLVALNTLAGPIIASIALGISLYRQTANYKNIMLFYLWYGLSQLTASAGFTAALLRHLMVWRMFTPRFLFQAAIMATIIPIVVFASLIRPNRLQQKSALHSL